jgi:hypothetical protein
MGVWPMCGVRFLERWAKWEPATDTVRAAQHAIIMNALLHDRLPIAKTVNAKAISLEDAPKG